MTTTSYSKAKANLIRAERTSVVTVTWKEWNGIDIITRKSNMKAWEALNLIDNINKLAFVRLSA